jgi:hypothetical protein
MHAAPKTSYNHPTDPSLMKQISYPAKAVVKAKNAWTEKRDSSSRQ